MQELKPCRSCGGEAEFQIVKNPYGWYSDGSEAVWVQCKKCHTCSTMQYSKKSAAEEWNRR